MTLRAKTEVIVWRDSLAPRWNEQESWYARAYTYRLEVGVSRDDRINASVSWREPRTGGITTIDKKSWPAPALTEREATILEARTWCEETAQELQRRGAES